ncbi:hypothetical protein Nepgr_027653 [Nepenthes gracilis]|uniref:F-box/LRR-repeat protein 15-like leucin rich repeat domain-containing protein n=1 Tax=Nepenthes gracilis TaxID=150966 RepID=A0AAD3TA72_NEPGR|nr:hypothetical protein Nepgr_027653 [Nepenthes gracilis]
MRSLFHLRRSAYEEMWLFAFWKHLGFAASSAEEAFGLTCRRWLHIQNISRGSLQFQCSFTLLDTSSLSRAIPNIRTLHLQRLLTRFQHLHSLSLSGCTQLPDSGLMQLQQYGPTLTALSLDCCFEITDDGLSFVANGCPSLTFINLYRCNITDAGLETLAKSCLGLEDVNLSYCWLITDHGIRVLVGNCSRISAIRISNCERVSGVGFEGCSETLVYLEAESCKLEPEGIAAIASGRGLEYLNISNLSWCIRGDGLGKIGAGFATRLKVLNLRLCRSMGSESVAAIAKGCPSLQEWNLAWCHEVRLSGWESIALNCRNLEKLHVNRCRNLCDRSLMALRNGCRKLSVLYMSGCPRISSNAIEFFRLFRGDVTIKKEEVLTVGPAWAFRR